jgi:hypothetical protein
LKKCCTLTEESIPEIEKDIVLCPIFDWDYPEDYFDWEFLNDEFDLGFTQEPQIEKINNGEMLRMSSKNKSVIIRLNDKKYTAILTTADKKTYELRVEFSNGIYNFGNNASESGYKDYILEQLVHHVNYNLLTLAISIIIRKTEKKDMGETEASMRNFISQDQKLMSILDRTRELFEERYETLMQLRNNT